MDRLPQVVLEHAVQLQALAAGDSQRGVADLVAQVELGQQLLARQLAAGNLRADHERIGLDRLAFAAVDPAGGACIAVVLLIGAVVLEQVDARLAEEVVGIPQFLADRSAQIVALDLGDLDRILLGLISHVGHQEDVLDWRECLQW